MIIFPAIDLRHGQVVRLKQGRVDRMSVFGTDPVDTARSWVDQGAEWLHVVNLDGALGELSPRAGAATDSVTDINLQHLLDICSEMPLTSIQFGGGIRQLGDLQRVFDLGASRAILGTAAVCNPEMILEAISQFGPERLVVGLDASRGAIVTHGWCQPTKMTPVGLGLAMKGIGVKYALYTDVQRDGMMTGVDSEGTADLARATGLRVIASGGVSSLSDLQRLVARQDDGIEGAIIGQALYTGAIALDAAIRLAHSGS